MKLRASILLAPASAVLAALSVAACGGSSHAPASRTVATTPPTRTVTDVVPPATSSTASPPATTSTASSGAPGPPSPSASSGPPAGCTPRDLGIHLGGENGAAGTEYTEFDFINVASHACTLEGFPGVSLVLTNGSIDDITNDRDTSRKAHLVTVQPGGSAPFIVGFISNAAHPCVESSHLRFIPPNDTSYEQIADRVQACGRFVDVTPVGYGITH